MRAESFDSQKMEASNRPKCRINRAPLNKSDKVDEHDKNVNMPYYLSSSTKREVDKRASEVLINNIHNEF